MVAEWVERARYDLDTARAMMDAERYLYVLFCCQQTVEKALKAVIVKKTGGLPPRIHNLIALAETAGLHLVDDIEDHLASLSVLYALTRYPEKIELPSDIKNHEHMTLMLGKTEEVTEWLFSMLK